MFRSTDFKTINVGSLVLIKSIRMLSAQPAIVKSAEVKLQDEWNSAKDYESVPHLTKLGLIRAFMPGGKYHNVQLIEMHKAIRDEYGNVFKFPGMLGRPDMLMTFSVEDAEKVFRFAGQQPFRRGFETLAYYRKKVRPDIYAEYGSLATEQCEDWWKMRSKVNPVMLKPQTIKLYVPQMDEIANDFLAMISKLRDKNNEVPANFGEYMNMWSLESVACISLNRRLGILGENRNENAEKLIKLIREFFTLSVDFEIKPSIWKFYQTKAFKQLISVYDGLTNIIMQYVEDAIEDLKKHPPMEGREESFLEKLLKIDKKVAIVMCVDALFAGVDTTSSASIGTLYCLAKNQDKQDKLREELRKIYPNKDEPLTPESMKNMPYLRAVIKEGIRLFPPTIGNARKVEEDVVLSGYKVPKGTEVVMALMLMHKDEKQFAQPEAFIPERWLKNNTDASCPHAKDAHPFAYLPFGYGSRMCIGKRLAQLEIEVLITRLIQNFKIEWHHPDMKIKSLMVNVPDGDLKFRLTAL